MHFILVADIHLASSTSESFGVDTSANFEQVLDRIKTHQPDHIVLMGDYSLKAPMRRDVEACFERLSALQIPLSFIAGNHDVSADIATICCENAPLVEGELFFQKRIAGTKCLFLDTSKGYIKEQQTVWLSEVLAKTTSPVHVFMHHPPIKMGVPFMDNNHAMMDEGGALFKVLFGGKTPVHVYSGHYHTARSAQVGIHSVHLCPSTYFQLDPSLPEFGVSHSMPGIRHVQLLEGEVRTWVELLPKHGR